MTISKNSRHILLSATVSTLAVVSIYYATEQANAQVVINYTGDENDLQPDPVSPALKSLLPDLSSNQNGNMIIVSDPSGGASFFKPTSVYGGYGVDISTVSDNSVRMESGNIQTSVHGGYGNGVATVSNNNVIFENGYVGGSVAGGQSYATISDIFVTSNNVIINGGEINDNVFGAVGYASVGLVDVSVTNNSLIINDGVIQMNAVGGHIDSSADGNNYVSNNTLHINGGILGLGGLGGVYGGQITAGGNGDLSTTNNNVTITGGEIRNRVYGGFSYHFGSGDSLVSGNSVAINGGEIIGFVEAGFVGGSGNITASGNSFLLSNGRVSLDAVGGSGAGSADINIIGNNVTVSGGEIMGTVVGGNGSGTGNILILNNSIVTAGGRINSHIYGGKGNIRDSGDISITDNSIMISGGEIVGDVYAGYAVVEDNATAIVTDNIITLRGNSSQISGSVYGGYILDNANNAVTDFDLVAKGNTLKLDQYSGSLGGVYNFQNYDWVLPKDVANGDVIINITGNSDVELSNTIHTLAIESGGSLLKAGDQIVMIDKATVDATGTAPLTPTKLEQGHFISYDVEMVVENQKFVLNIDGPGELTPKSKAFSEGRAAALGFLSQASDLIATAGIDNVRVMARSKDNDQNSIPFLPFLIVKGDSNRYDTGSHVKVHGFHMAAGLASGAELEQGHKVTLGAFFEYGRGTYDTYNSFTNYASVRGSGDTHYAGGGIFGRFDFAGTGLGYVADLSPTQADGLYMEASIRAGRVNLDFDSSDLIDAEGYRGNYNSKSNYWGGHAAVGYVFNFDERQALDVYGRYLWTRMNSDSVTIGKDRLHFNSASSNRIQLGGRYNYAYSDQFKPYIGAAYEYEFSGSIGAQAYNFRLDEPSLKGSTGIIEAGFSFTPDAKIPDLSINVTGQAFFGQRQGGAGEIKLKYQF